MKKVIVTGATGFIGEALCEELIKRNYEVIAVVRNMSKVTEVCYMRTGEHSGN